MAYTTQYTLFENVAFRGRVRLAMMIAAAQVQGESPSSFSNAVYDKRQRLATTILQDSGGNWWDSFALGVAADESISAASTDAVIQTRVALIFSKIAGVRGGE